MLSKKELQKYEYFFQFYKKIFDLNDSICVEKIKCLIEKGIKMDYVLNASKAYKNNQEELFLLCLNNLTDSIQKKVVDMLKEEVNQNDSFEQLEKIISDVIKLKLITYDDKLAKTLSSYTTEEAKHSLIEKIKLEHQLMSGIKKKKVMKI